MDAHIDFYRDWFGWLEARSAQIARNGDPLKLVVFMADVSDIMRNEIGLWGSLTDVFKGNPFSIAMKAGSWVAAHPDPLKDTREKMRSMRAKFGEVTANVK